MQALTNRAKPVDRKKMNAWERMYLPEILRGMFITFKHIFRKKVTINYPEQTRPFSPVFRGLQILNRDEEGRERLHSMRFVCSRLSGRGHNYGSCRTSAR